MINIIYAFVIGFVAGWTGGGVLRMTIQFDRMYDVEFTDAIDQR